MHQEGDLFRKIRPSEKEGIKVGARGQGASRKRDRGDDCSLFSSPLKESLPRWREMVKNQQERLPVPLPLC